MIRSVAVPALCAFALTACAEDLSYLESFDDPRVIHFDMRYINAQCLTAQGRPESARSHMYWWDLDGYQCAWFDAKANIFKTNTGHYLTGIGPAPRYRLGALCPSHLFVCRNLELRAWVPRTGSPVTTIIDVFRPEGVPITDMCV